MTVVSDLIPIASGRAHLGVNGGPNPGAFDFSTIRPFGHIIMLSGVFLDPLFPHSGIIRFSKENGSFFPRGRFEFSKDGGKTFGFYAGGQDIELECTNDASLSATGNTFITGSSSVSVAGTFITIDSSSFNSATGDVTIGAAANIKLQPFKASGQLEYRFGPNQAWHWKPTYSTQFHPIPHSGQILQMILENGGLATVSLQTAYNVGDRIVPIVSKVTNGIFNRGILVAKTTPGTNPDILSNFNTPQDYGIAVSGYLNPSAPQIAYAYSIAKLSESRLYIRGSGLWAGSNLTNIPCEIIIGVSGTPNKGSLTGSLFATGWFDITAISGLAIRSNRAVEVRAGSSITVNAGSTLTEQAQSIVQIATNDLNQTAGTDINRTATGNITDQASGDVFITSLGANITETASTISLNANKNVTSTATQNITATAGLNNSLVASAESISLTAPASGIVLIAQSGLQLYKQGLFIGSGRDLHINASGKLLSLKGSNTGEFIVAQDLLFGSTTAGRIEANANIVPNASGTRYLGFDIKSLQVRPFLQVHQMSGVFYDGLIGQSGIIRFNRQSKYNGASGAMEVSTDGGLNFEPIVYFTQTIIGNNTSDATAGSLVRFFDGSTDNDGRLQVPSGMQMVVLACEGVARSATTATAGSYTVDFGIRVFTNNEAATQGGSDNIFCSATATRGAIMHCYSEGTLKKPLTTVAAGSTWMPIWRNNASSPGAIGTNIKRIILTYKYIQA